MIEIATAASRPRNEGQARRQQSPPNCFFPATTPCAASPSRRYDVASLPGGERRDRHTGVATASPRGKVVRPSRQHSSSRYEAACFAAGGGCRRVRGPPWLGLEERASS